MTHPAAGSRGGRRARFVLVGVALLLVSLAGWWVVSARLRTEEYASFTRPDGHYRVVVLRRSAWPGAMPGQAGDAPGKVRLLDRAGRVLQETSVEMVQLVDSVEWGERRVRIKLVAEWDLPD